MMQEQNSEPKAWVEPKVMSMTEFFTLLEQVADELELRKVEPYDTEVEYRVAYQHGYNDAISDVQTYLRQGLQMIRTNWRPK